VSGKHNGPTTAQSDRAKAAALGPGMLRVDRLETTPGGGDPVLDELPVPGVAAGADDPAVLVLVGEVQSVLQPHPTAPVRHRWAIGGGRAVGNNTLDRRKRRRRSERETLGSVVDDDGREGGESRCDRGGGEH
jgi:hypothetical protein